jgi:hypothetical protein
MKSRNELKTLEHMDRVLTICRECGNEDPIDAIDLLTIKKEIIKWIKVLMGIEVDRRRGKGRDERITFQISILMEIFNIKESDLK